MKQLTHPLVTVVVAPGLSVAAVHVAVARSDDDERYALTMWFGPPTESALDVNVKSHHTPAFAA
jgi:hypothetical protein